MTSFEPKNLTTGKLHGYLLNTIAPRPIALASTLDAGGCPNLSPFSFFNVFSANPAMLIFSPARRVKNNTTKHTLENAIHTKEVVINVVNYDIVQQMSLSSSEYPKGINEFEKSGFTMLKSDLVNPFRVAESPVQFECKVKEIISLGDQGGSGNLILCEVVKFHINDAVFSEDGEIDQHKLDLVSRAGGHYYSRAKLGFFEVSKPLSKLGIGIDAFPDEIRNSKILTGNDLGMLGHIENLPNHEQVKAFKLKHNISDNILKTEDKHKKAQNYLRDSDVNSAWNMLLS